MKTIQLPVIVHKQETLSDNGDKLTLYTRELRPEEAGVVRGFVHKEAWLTLSEVELEPEEIQVKEERVDKGQKTQAQRLRNCIFRLWETTKQTQDSESYYQSTMEKIITRVKEQLD